MGHMKILGSALRHDFGSRVGLKFLSGLQLIFGKPPFLDVYLIILSS